MMTMRIAALVGQTPWSAADPLVGLPQYSGLPQQRDQGVARRPGGLPQARWAWMTSPLRGFELFVAGRYLRAKRKQAVISVITVISILGVSAGVMALIIALAINNGFRNTLQRSLLGATAHVTILEKKPEFGIQNWQELDAKLRKIPHVTSASPSLYGPVLAVGPIQSTGAVLKGISLEFTPDML